MERTTLLMVLFAFFLLDVNAHAQGFIQLGTQYVDDQAHRLIVTSDGGYITAGSAGPNAVLYRTDCLGNLVAKIEKSAVPGPAAFWDVIELADGSIVAVGVSGMVSPSDTGSRVLLLKTTPMLAEIASSSFSILGKDALGKSLAQTPGGSLLVYGEVAGNAPDLSDVFFQRVDPITLQPSAVPVIGNNGIDFASRILPTADGNYLLAGSSLLGDISNPNAMIDNYLRAYKVDENGALLWQSAVAKTYLAKYGVARSCGAAQGIQSDNFVLGGHIFNSANTLQDLFFMLISNDGVVLDTAYAFAAGQQKSAAISENTAAPGAFILFGESDGSPTGLPSLAIGQAYEFANELYIGQTLLDINNLVSLRDLVEIDPGRFAVTGIYPDNPTVLNAGDIVVSTPEVTVGVVYQNCALAATIAAPAVAFQWLYEGQPIPNANQGVFFPDQPGLYEVQVLDEKGCYGVSDTFRVKGPVADFTLGLAGTTVVGINNSQGASSYVWDFGDGNNSTAFNPMHTYAAPGLYNVKLIVTNQCGLKDTLVQQIGITPTDEVAWLNHFSLSPNPTSDVFNLEMSGTPQDKVEFMLFNSVGQMLLLEASSFQNGFLQKNFDLGPFPGDVYSLQIRSGKEVKNVRVVKR